MIEVVPDYYNKFKCIAGKCKHSCCVGWEIDIDDDTMEFYNLLGGEMGEKIRANIQGEPPHFVLAAGERCPFLKDSGLCEIISCFGEEALCDICSLHPRFFNFYSHFGEAGLGLCCEEAARIILTADEKFTVNVPGEVSLTTKESEFIKLRFEIFTILQNREKSIGTRFNELADAFNIKLDFSLKKLADTYLSLERLDDKWTEKLTHLKSFSFDGTMFEDESFQIFFEQLSVYFIYRHLPKAIDSREYAPIVRFALLGCILIGAIFAYTKIKSFEEMVDIARMYSAETEYSDENVKALINAAL